MNNNIERNGTASCGIDNQNFPETLAVGAAAISRSANLVGRSSSATDHAEWHNQGEAPSDFPVPRSLTDSDFFIWDTDAAPAENYVALGTALAASGDLFRMPAHAAGLLLASPNANVPPTPIQKGSQLAPVIADRLRLLVVKDGKPKGGRLPSTELATLLGSELFLQQFLPVDRVAKVPMFIADFQLVKPGYNDAGRGQRVLYFGEPARIDHGLDATNQFLDVMAFATPSDRTNAIAAALTIQLRNNWPGAKPLIVITSNKSHAGKETLVDFACAGTEKVAISYESADWAFQKAFVATLRQNPEVGVVNVENVRLDRRNHPIRSAFLERFITDPAPELYAPGTGTPFRRVNDLVVTLTTTFGSFSEDCMNRSLHSHLAPVGDVAARQHAIGNPRFEYLPARRNQIAAELRGMIVRWVDAGKPLDHQARHPFTDWARTIGGILMVSGLRGFLQNYSHRRSTDDPVRRALGLLGTAMPDQWASAAKWAPLVAHLGLTRQLIAEADRESAEGRARGIGVVLSVHRDETLLVETDDEALTLRLEKARRRFEGGRPETRYRFAVVDRATLPEDGSSA